jgi:diaminopimelate decarboxylase
MKYLTKEQERKADKIVELLRELKKSGVHPLIIDGGGGAGISFVRCSNNEFNELADIILGSDFDKRSEVEEYIYEPNKTWEVPIETLVP